MAPKNKPSKQTEKPRTFLTLDEIDDIKSGVDGGLLPLSDKRKKQLEPLAEDFGIVPAWKKETEEKGGSPEKR